MLDQFGFLPNNEHRDAPTVRRLARQEPRLLALLAGVRSLKAGPTFCFTDAYNRITDHLVKMTYMPGDNKKPIGTWDDFRLMVVELTADLPSCVEGCPCTLDD